MAGLLDPLGVLGTRHKPVRDYVWTAGLTAVLMLFLSFVLPVTAWMVFLVPLIILNPALIRCHGLLNVSDAQAGLGQIFIGFVTVGLVAFAAMVLDGQLSHVPPRFLETRPTIAAMPKMRELVWAVAVVWPALSAGLIALRARHAGQILAGREIPV